MPFLSDLDWSIQVRNKHLVPYYKRQVKSGKWLRYKLLDNWKDEVEQNLQYSGVDTIVTLADGTEYTIEEKFSSYNPKFPDPAMFVETLSCTKPGSETAGWIDTCTADCIVFCFERASGMVCHFYNFTEFRNWFKEHEEDFHLFTHKKGNKSRCRIVPVKAVSGLKHTKTITLQ